MNAAFLTRQGPIEETALATELVALPQPREGEVRLRVAACGVCRTDLHIAEGELRARKLPLIPGHQIVGYVDACGANVDRALGTRLGVSWLAGTDGTCPYCMRGEENLCDQPRFTGYDVDGGYAQYATARADFCFDIPAQLDDVHAAPLLCAGAIGFRTIRVADVRQGQRVGLYGFGASAHLALPVLQSLGCEVFVATRGAFHHKLARTLGAAWVGDALDSPPVLLDRALTFAPSGDVVVAALSALRKGGIVAVNAIHLDRIPQFDYDTLLWGERQLRSVANMTRQDAIDFLSVAARIGLLPDVITFGLEDATEALRALKSDRLGAAAAVLVPVH